VKTFEDEGEEAIMVKERKGRRSEKSEKTGERSATVTAAQRAIKALHRPS
jgi:hypothetical protein